AYILWGSKTVCDVGSRLIISLLFADSYRSSLDGGNTIGKV
ncbi:hypothetical protein KSS87_001058, partial [Heliosperma pusillum]